MRIFTLKWPEYVLFKLFQGEHALRSPSISKLCMLIVLQAMEYIFICPSFYFYSGIILCPCPSNPLHLILIPLAKIFTKITSTVLMMKLCLLQKCLCNNIICSKPITNHDQLVILSDYYKITTNVNS